MKKTINAETKFRPSKVVIFEEIDGYHFNYDPQGALDARGPGYPSRRAAMREARRCFNEGQAMI